MSDQEEWLEASDAAQYLAEKWGIPSYSTEALKKLRQRRGLQPGLSGKTSTFWRKSELDQISKPDRSRPRGPRKKKGHAEGEDASSSSVILIDNSRAYRVLAGVS